MGLAGGFRQPVAARAGQHQIDGAGETHAMSGGDENRPRTDAAAQGRADDFALVEQRAPCATSLWRLGELTDQPMLGHTDGR